MEGGGSPFTPATRARTHLKPATCVKYSEKAGEMSRKCNFVSLSAAMTLTMFRVYCFQQLSLIVVGTGFLFSFVFHWGTVEPVSSAGTGRKEHEQGKSVKILFSPFCTELCRRKTALL